MKLPKLMIKKGCYQGMRGGNEVYGADYYLVADVNKYKKEAEDLLTYANDLEEALKQLISIVEIHPKASKNNFAWAELDFANEVIGNT